MHSYSGLIINLHVIAKKTTIFYCPVLWSIFSVLVIFWLCWPILIKPHYHSMEVNWVNDSMIERWGCIPARQFLNIALTGDSCTDRMKLDFGDRYIKEILKSEDKIHGIWFHFSAKSKFVTFVEVLDMCNVDECHMYIASDKGIIVYYVEPLYPI